MQGHSPPRREAREAVARCAGARASSGRDVAGTLNAAFGEKLGLDNQHVDNGCSLFITHTLRAAVRRITPLEAERLQGFPDHHTAVLYRGKPAADAPRYKALGNSMAVPVLAWIGQRIAAVEANP